MALTTVQVHGQILAPVTNTPAVGTVTFYILNSLRDVVDDVVYSPMSFVATLDVNGEFTITLPATDNPDVTPLNWVYQVYVNTDVWTSTLYFQLPFAPGVTQFADLVPLDYDPCVGTIGGTPVPPPDTGVYVLKTGDTMTGNLSIQANLAVSGSVSASYEGVNGDVMRLLSSVISTNVTSGGELVPNADPTKIDISAMTGWIVDYNSTTFPLGPTNPQITYVTWPGVTALTPAFAPFTHYLIDSTGTLVQQATTPTPQQRRDYCYLGLTLTQGGVIVVDQTLPVIPSQLNNQLLDLMEAAGPFIVNGNVLRSNGANLTFAKNAGDIFTRAFSQVPDYRDPHNGHLIAQAPVQFRHITALIGSAGPITTILNVANYDPNGAGVVTPVGGGANTSTNFRVWGFANNTVTEQILVQYGQNTYASLAAAVNGLGSGNYIPQPATSSGALLGWISVIRSATNLSDPTQCVFTKASKFPTP